MVDIRSLPSLHDKHVDRMIEFLRRAAKGRVVDRDAVEASVLEILHATGLAHDGTENGRIWLELADGDLDHKALRAGFRKLARSKDPIKLARQRPELQPGLNKLLRARWGRRWVREKREGEPATRTIDWSRLSEDERQEVRDLCTRLADFHDSQVSQGRQQLNDVDTALAELAEAFLAFTGKPGPVHGVPYAQTSHFIRFAVAALEPVALTFEVSEKAISERWRRQVRDARDAEQAERAQNPSAG